MSATVHNSLYVCCGLADLVILFLAKFIWGGPARLSCPAPRPPVVFFSFLLNLKKNEVLEVLIEVLEVLEVLGEVLEVLGEVLEVLAEVLEVLGSAYPLNAKPRSQKHRFAFHF